MVNNKEERLKLNDHSGIFSTANSALSAKQVLRAWIAIEHQPSPLPCNNLA